MLRLASVSLGRGKAVAAAAPTDSIRPTDANDHEHDFGTFHITALMY